MASFSQEAHDLFTFEIELVPATGKSLIINGFPGFLPLKCSWATDKMTEFLNFDENAGRFFGRKNYYTDLTGIDGYIEHFLRWEFEEETRVCAHRLLGAYTETLVMAHKNQIDKLFRLSEMYFPST